MNATTKPDSTQLALDRTWLAHERTLMAWVRTSASMISFGFTIYKFFQFEPKAQRPEHVLLSPRNFAVILVATGIITLVAATIQHRKDVKRLTSISRDKTGLSGRPHGGVDFCSGRVGSSRCDLSRLSRVGIGETNPEICQVWHQRRARSRTWKTPPQRVSTFLAPTWQAPRVESPAASTEQANSVAFRNLEFRGFSCST